MKPVRKWFALVGLAVALASIAGFASPRQADDKKNAEFKGDPYPLDVCIVMGKKLGSMGEPIVKSYDGREIRFCCESCVPKFEADKATYLNRLDAEIISQQTAHYPLKNCVVMEDDPLEGVHEETAQVVYRNRLVKFCCEGCVSEFEKDPAKYIAKLDAAVIKEQSEKYPLTTCAISGGDLANKGDLVYNHVVGTTLIKFCCKGCVAKFEKDPLPVIKKVHDGWAAMHKDASHDAKPDKPAKP